MLSGPDWTLVSVISLLYRPELYEDTSWLTNTTRVIRDYSGTVGSLPQFYLVPHLWSGVLARMVSGYRCVVADQELSDNINRWRDTVRPASKLNSKLNIL